MQLIILLPLNMWMNISGWRRRRSFLPKSAPFHLKFVMSFIGFNLLFSFSISFPSVICIVIVLMIYLNCFVFRTFCFFQKFSHILFWRKYQSFNRRCMWGINCFDGSFAIGTTFVFWVYISYNRQFKRKKKLGVSLCRSIWSLIWWKHLRNT